MARSALRGDELLARYPEALAALESPNADPQLEKFVSLIRSENLTVLEAASRLGVKRSRAYALLADPFGDRARERKRKVVGKCQGCGGETRNGGANPPKWCKSCFSNRKAERNRVIVEMWNAGCTAQQIGERLKMAPATVAAWVGRNRARLGIKVHRLPGGRVERARRREELVRLKREGVSNREIAKRLGYASESSAARAYAYARKALGIEIDRSLKATPAELIEAYTAGMPLSEIAERFGYSCGNVVCQRLRALRSQGYDIPKRRRGRA